MFRYFNKIIFFCVLLQLFGTTNRKEYQSFYDRTFFRLKKLYEIKCTVVHIMVQSI